MTALDQHGYEELLRKEGGPLSRTLPLRWNDDFPDDAGRARTLLTKDGYGIVSFHSSSVPHPAVMDALRFAGDANGTGEGAGAMAVQSCTDDAGFAFPLRAERKDDPVLGPVVVLADAAGRMLGTATAGNWMPLADEIVGRANALASVDFRRLAPGSQEKHITVERAHVEMDRQLDRGPAGPARQQCPVYPTPLAAPCHQEPSADGSPVAKWADCHDCVGHAYADGAYESVMDGLRTEGPVDLGV